MKKIKTFFLMIAFIFLISIATASATYYYTTNWYYQGSPVNNVRAMNYVCNDAGCYNLGTKTFDQTSIGNSITVPYAIPSPTYGYATYWFASCYKYQELAWTPCCNGSYTRNVNFSKHTNCFSGINSYNIPNTVVENTTFLVTANVQSAITEAPVAPWGEPSDAEIARDFLSSETDINLVIKNTDTGAVVFNQTQKRHILRDTAVNVNFSWTPNLNQAGNYTVTLKTLVPDCKCTNDVEDTKIENIVVTNFNRAPVAYNLSFITNENTPFNLNLSCSDPDSDVLSYNILTNPAHGSLSGTGKTRVYTPNNGYNGNDLFTYRCNDGSLNSNTATVSITVRAIMCFNNNECGNAFVDEYCNNNDFFTNTTTPTCYLPGTVGSYCANVSSVASDNCNHICSDSEGCDYTECSDSVDNDLDGYIDYPADPGCVSYYDDNETNPFVCSTNADCGGITQNRFCNNLTYVVNTTTPTCFNPATVNSYCLNINNIQNENCNHICSGIYACDYTECSDSLDNDGDGYVDYPLDLGCYSYYDNNESDGAVNCTTNIDCGNISVVGFCNGNSSYNQTVIVPTCYLSGTEHSYCLNVVNQTIDNCNYICNNNLGCDYTECSDSLDNDGDGYVDFPWDLGCDDYYDDDESDGAVNCNNDLDCGIPTNISFCYGSAYNINQTIPRCELAGTEHSYCYNQTVSDQDDCSYICSDVFGCDYTECSDSVDNDLDGYIDYPADPGCVSYYDDNETDSLINCSSDIECGIPYTEYLCNGNMSYDRRDAVPICINPGTTSSYCSEHESWTTIENCNHICSGIYACDYTECSDSLDNDGDGYVDYPLDLGCYSYYDNNESDGAVNCTIDIDCGNITNLNSCDGNLTYNQTVIVPTCYLGGTEHSYCANVVNQTIDNCNYICNNNLGCDYTECSDSLDNDGDGYVDFPWDLGCDDYYDDDESDGNINCSADSDCGNDFIFGECSNLTYNLYGTHYICQAAGTEHSYCESATVMINQSDCNYICSNSYGCDYTECSDSVDNDGDNYIDYPIDLGCSSYYDDDESDGNVNCSSDLDCGSPYNVGSCAGLNYTNYIFAPTCYLPGTEYSYCYYPYTFQNFICSYICSNSNGCDYTACSDGIDNDGDGLIDLEDPGCSDIYDNDEKNVNKEDYPRRKIFIENIRMNNQVYELVKPGDDLNLDVSFENMGYYDIKKSSIRATVEGLGISRKIGPFNGPDTSDEMTKMVPLEIPCDAKPGVYTLRMSLFTDGQLKRTRHRDFRVV